jgi:hypothetical protein
MRLHPLLLEVLDALEEQEMQLLSWGVVDTGLSPAELTALVDAQLDRCLAAGDCPYYAADDVIEAMRQGGLLHTSPDGRTRSRMAEAVRLLQRLRQVFPERRHPTRGDWQSAPNLVADFRIARRKRRYPKRDIDPSQWLAGYAKNGIHDTAAAALKVLAIRDDHPMLLAGFQCRATQRILDSIRRGEQAGTVVCAGTGSGKTLAFYLPSLSHLAELVDPRQAGHWVKAVALYPRNELLKDQLAEVYGQCRRLDDLQAARRARKLSIAAYFGPAPRDASAQALQDAGWQRGADRYFCDYVTCPNGCRGPMSWLDADRNTSRERLVCDRCGSVVQDDEIRLTRRRIEQQPPDLLFTSTEMLNRRLSDSRARHLFGIGVPAQRDLRTVLLDEVHTYVGNHGAQVAYLIRRWQSLIGAPVHWVGLSATLRDAVTFFRDLTGLSDREVAEVSPSPDEHESEGAEYMIALRGDPASRTSLLSTTIQASMLLSRILDQRDSPLSGNTYGTRSFVFTDDIDVTNRLYFDLLDAEGRDSFGRVDASRPAGGLAVLRTPDPSDLRRYEHGQDWLLAQGLGHDLSSRLVVSRTSSQDAGVDRAADVIVATASLEVGFNDPSVGAVLQHKAPLDVAQYLQRKGRAGRLRQTRPFMLVALSDYGRDRVAYQNYQVLFDPLLPPRRLPLRNRNVLRMQAVYSTIDYLRHHASEPGHVWRALAGPADTASARRLQQSLVQELERLLIDHAQADVLRRHLRASLRIDEEELDVLLWGYPRPLLLAALPTALRRLKSDWAGSNGPRSDLTVRDNPLPDFVPASLFNDLNLPEVGIDAPPQTPNGPSEQYAMPLLQAMQQFAPGRVSRRFGIVHRRVRHWLPLPASLGPEFSLDLDTVGDFQPIGRFDLVAEGVIKAVPVFMPRWLRVERPPATIADSSNGRLVWHTQIVPPDEATALPLPGDIGSGALLTGIDAFTHQTLNPVEVRRFATGAHAHLRYVDGRDESVAVRFAAGPTGEESAVGFALLVDGLRLQSRNVPALWEDSAGHATAKWRALRLLRYRDEVACGIGLSLIDNDFLRVRLGEVFLAAACRRALRTASSLQTAAAAIAMVPDDTDVLAVLDLVLQSAATNGASPDGGHDTLSAELRTALRDPAVRNGLLAAAELLWRPIDKSWQAWLSRVYRDTLAAAVLQATVALCPGIDDSQLVVDTDPGPISGRANESPDIELWLTETSVGGAGIIEQFVVRYASDPRRFTALLDRCLDRGEWEHSDSGLRRLLAELKSGALPGVAEAMQCFREAERSQDSSSAFSNLRRVLARHGFPQHHAFFSAIANRLLRPGSSPASDNFLAWALSEWEHVEQHLGIELDLPTVAPLLSERHETSTVVDDFAPNQAVSPAAWRTSVVTGLLWPRGATLRASRLQTWDPFWRRRIVEPWLPHSLLVQAQWLIDLKLADWREQLLSVLAKRGHATTVAPIESRHLIADVCTLLAMNAVEHEYLVVYARIRAVRLQDAAIYIDAEVPEILGRIAV